MVLIPKVLKRSFYKAWHYAMIILDNLSNKRNNATEQNLTNKKEKIHEFIIINFMCTGITSNKISIVWKSIKPHKFFEIWTQT